MHLVNKAFSARESCALVSNDENLLVQHFIDHKEQWKNFWGFPEYRAAERIWVLRHGLPIPRDVSSQIWGGSY